MALDAPSPAPLEQRFITTRDGTRVFVRTTTGARPTAPPLVLLDGLGCDGYVWKYILDWFAPEHPIVHWQYRGHGRSDAPILDDITLELVIRDLEDVCDACDIDDAIFFGHSMGVQVALEAFALARRRVRGLVLLFGSYEYPIESWHGAPGRLDPPRPSNLVMKAVFDRAARLLVRHGGLLQPAWRRVIATPLAYELATRLEVDGARLAHEDFQPYLDHLAAMDCRVFFAFARALAAHSARDLLPTVDVPTLIMGGGRDTFTPLWRSLEMAHRIPGAELYLLDDATHSAPLEQPARINRRIARFLRTRFASAR